jgi:peptidoglycan/LPS O-acetylase OafA/YrhL
MKRLDALEGLRGYAVFLVFLTHAFGLLIQKLYPVDPDHFSIHESPSAALTALVLLFRSHYGVDLFFVLSGLLMADIAIRRWPGARHFLARRALRIYPAYLASAAVVGIVVVLWYGRSFSATDVAANAAFLQGFFVLGIPAINPVTWSLAYEAAFYLAVPLLALAWSGAPQDAPSRATSAVLAGAFALIVATSAALPGEKTIFFAYFALFIPGIWLGLADADTRRALAERIPTALAVLAWAAFELAVKLEGISYRAPLYYLASGIAGGLLVWKACDGKSALARLLTRRPMLWLGRHSYSFFLMHYIVLHVFARILDGVVGTAHRMLYAGTLLAGGFALSLVAARILYLLAERFYFERR